MCVVLAICGVKLSPSMADLGQSYTTIQFAGYWTPCSGVIIIISKFATGLAVFRPNLVCQKMSFYPQNVEIGYTISLAFAFVHFKRSFIECHKV